jgi:two-component system response regulator HydG
VSDLVLVADDDRVQCALLQRWLSEAGFEVRCFGDGAACLAELERSLPAAICLDLAMPGLDGLATLEAVRRRDRALPVLILTANAAVDRVIAATQLGAYDYLLKPVERSRLLTSMRNAIETFRLSLRVAELEREARWEHDASGITGRSPVMRHLFQLIDRAAASDITVLIHGESGTGKELVARSLHQASARRSGPLVPVNCAAIPETLQESELFGHERGAFTGALDRRKGKIELADRGTLFLDEIGEIALSLQAKLLRGLQERAFIRVGGAAELRSDFRLIAATHRDLASEVAAGRFREDLFFRLAVFEIEVPPLRQRGDDVLLLAQRFVADTARTAGRPPLELSTEAAAALLAYPFPGNVRELQNAIQRAVAVGNGDRIDRRDLPARLLTAGGEGPARTAADPEADDRTGAGREVPALEAPDPGFARPFTLAEIEMRAIQAALARNGGNVSRAARELGVDRTTLHRKMARR